jgi:LCP family protein required for cell wall assembly
LSENTKSSKSQNPELARHARVKPQGKVSAFWGLAFKGVAVALAAVLTFTGLSIWQLSGDIKGNGITLLDANGNALPKVSAADLKGPINMLLVGSDTRAGQGKGFGSETSTLADVIILLHVSADRKNAVALSFPRDLLVPWPACPSTSGGPGYLPQALGQINATIANGGPGCTLLTVEKLTGVKIPYLAMINFKGVSEMSSAIGGVEVCVANPIIDTYTHLNLSAGKHVLIGRQALQFLRTRHGIGDGSDLSRISNQQVYMTSLFRKVKSQGVLTNPILLYSLAKAAARNMQLSDSLNDVGTLVALAGALKNVQLDKMTFLQLPSKGGLPAPYSGRVAPVYEQANILFAKLQNDDPIIIKKANTGSGASVDTSSPSPSSSASSTSSATETALPDWARGTNGSVKSCSN